MSQTKNDTTSTNTRSKRIIKPSQRAVDIAQSGEDVPGLPSISSPADPDKTFFADISNPVDGSASPGGSANMSAVIGKPGGTSTADHFLPVFEWPRFCIYMWQPPRPKDFLNLPESRKACKRRTDDQEKSRDIDDGSDDWYEFSGIREDYNRLNDASIGEFRMEHVIAGTFVKRAKRAFWAGKNWEEFEFQERTTNTEAQARAERDPKRRKLLMECMLDNSLRLAIFDRLKKRLCEEIWLEEYHEAPGLVRFKMPKKDSKVSSFTGGPYADLSQQQPAVEPTAAERENGVTGWQMDGLGHRQPLYGEETELPSGMGSFIRNMNAQREAAAGSLLQPADPGRAANDQSAWGRELSIRTHRPLGASTAEELAMRAPDFESSDEEGA